MPRRPAERRGPRYFTTFDVASMLDVSAPTVVNWVNAGLLPAHRTPGGHRRIRQEDLAAFARSHDYPLPPDIAGAPVVARPSRRVLIVDDDPDYCALVRAYLARVGGWEVEVADSGFKAGLQVATFRPGVVLLDLMMPGMDGFEVLRVLKADAAIARIPVVACTAARDPAIDERVSRDPFAGYVQKTNRLEQVVIALERALAAV